MSSKKPESYEDEVPFEQALDRTGFGIYNFSHTLLTGLTIIAFSCVSYSSSVLVPSSACELETTVAEQGLLASMPFVGSILGAFIWGFLGDTRGRHRMLLLSLMLSIFLNTLGSISVNWRMLLVVQFFTSLAASGQYTLSMTLLSECIPLARRNLMMLLVSSIFMLSQGIMAVLAIPVIPLSFSYYLPTLDIYWNSWRTVMVMYSVPSIFCFTWYLFIEESPKFLFMKGEEEKALEVLRVIHRKNTWKSTGEFQIKKLLADESSSTIQKRSIKEQFMPLFKPPLLKNTVIMVTLMVQEQVGAFKVWLPTIANQVIQTLQTGSGSDLSVCGILNLRADLEPDPDRAPCSLNETALLMVLTVAAFISVFNLLITTVVDRTGRRNMTIIVTSVIGSAGILVNLVPNAIGSSILFMVFLLGMVVYGLYTAISVALFPTEVRVMAVSLGLAVGRLATFANIQILNFMIQNNSCAMAFYIFGAIFVSSALVASLLPDDRKKMANKDDEEKTTEL